MTRITAFVRRHWILTTLLVALVGGGWYWYSQQSAATTAAVPTTTTAAVERGDLRITVTGSGQVEAVSQVDLKPVAAGDAIEVVSVHVTNNQAVHKGDLIAMLDTADASSSVRDAELAVRAAEIKMRQTEKLNKDLTEDDRWARQTQEVSLQQARNRLTEARRQLQDYAIRAPFDGIVTGLAVAAGDTVSRSDTVASVITSEMRAVVSLNEVDAANVHEGDTVTLSFEALPDVVSVRGSVARIDTIGTVQQNVVSYDAVIALDASVDGLKPGMSVSVEILQDERTGVLLVPSGAVRSDKSGTYVMMVDVDGQQKRVAVTAGLSDGVETEIISGLTEGAEVVVQKRSTTSTGNGSASGTNNRNPMSAFLGIGGR